MDGRFVPNITIGPLVVQRGARGDQLPLDVHLMIVEPERYMEDFAKAGADIISVHVEAVPTCTGRPADPRLGKKAGVALNPHTPLTASAYVLGDCRSVLVMSVNPGFGGQAFIPAAVPKIRALREEIERAGWTSTSRSTAASSPTTPPRSVAAGANVLVAGAAVFGEPQSDYAQAPSPRCARRARRRSPAAIRLGQSRGGVVARDEIVGVAREARGRAACARRRGGWRGRGAAWSWTATGPSPPRSRRPPARRRNA